MARRARRTHREDRQGRRALAVLGDANPRAVITADHRWPVGQSVTVPSETIPVLRVADANRACGWYERLGFEREWEHRFEPALPAFVAMARAQEARVFLSEHSGDAQPNGLVYLRVPDVAAIAQEFGAELIEQPWGSEVHLVDPDGNRVRVGITRA
jgi:catechol 2,3-dioxygenase-like lactoylglutathione lyase family enzyme